MPACRFILMGLLGLGACQGPEPARQASLKLPPERNHLDASAGLSFAVPDTWSVASDAAVDVLHGPAGTDEFYATLAVQRRVARPQQRLDEAVALALAPVSQDTGFVWDNLSVEAVGQDLALGYAVRFNALEMTFRQVGLVFVHNGVLVAMTLSAPSELFEGAVNVFERAKDSLLLLPCVVGPKRLKDVAPVNFHHSTRSL